MQLSAIDLLVAERKKKGLSQSDVGKHLGVSKQAVSRWELRRTRLPVDTAIKWANYLDVPLSQLEQSSNDLNTCSKAL